MLGVLNTAEYPVKFCIVIVCPFPLITKVFPVVLLFTMLKYCVLFVNIIFSKKVTVVFVVPLVSPV